MQYSNTLSGELLWHERHVGLVPSLALLLVISLRPKAELTDQVLPFHWVYKSHDTLEFGEAPWLDISYS